MRRAYSYIRFSKRDQAEGDSLRRQLEGTQAYCDRKGLLLDDSLSLYDLGVSAFRGKNARVGALARFLEAVQSGRVPKGAVLVIENLDRLTRDELDAAFDQFRGILAAGVEITSLEPFREYTRASLKDIRGLLEPLFILSRAHEESAMKSVRLRAMWQAKRDRMREEPATTICPAWLRPRADGKGFEPIPEAVRAVLRVHELAREGYGIGRIVPRLRQEGIAPISGRSECWNGYYVGHLLRTRAVLGECQPHVIRDGKRVPQGDPLPHYFPAIMSEADWRRTRDAVTRRTSQKGPMSKRITNLFTGILYDARDGCTMVLRHKGGRSKRFYLLSSGCTFRKKDTPCIFFPYDVIERGFLSFVGQDLIVELLRGKAEGRAEEITRRAEELADLDRRVKAVQRAVEEEPDYEEQLGLLRKLLRRKKAESQELERLRQEQCHGDVETLGEVRHILTVLRDCPPAELPDLRTRLRARVRSLVDSIWVLPEGDRRRKLATVQIFFRNGSWMRCTLEHPHPGGSLTAISGPVERLSPRDDLRQWRHLGEKPAFASTHGRGFVWTKFGLEQLEKARLRVASKSDKKE